VHIIGFIVRIYEDARASEYQIRYDSVFFYTARQECTNSGRLNFVGWGHIEVLSISPPKLPLWCVEFWRGFLFFL